MAELSERSAHAQGHRLDRRHHFHHRPAHGARRRQTHLLTGSLLSSLAAALALPGLHLLAARFSALQAAPRAPALTLCSGAALAFIAVQLFPRLVAERAALAASLGLAAHGAIQLMVHLSLAGGLVAFGLYRWVKREAGHAGIATEAAAAANIGLYVAMNVCVGYLLFGQGLRGYAPVLLLALAKGSAFVVVDRAFMDDLGPWYVHGRHLTAAALPAGWTIADLLGFDDAAALAMLSVIAGVLVVNVMKEEVPAEHRARFGALLAGAAGYAAVAAALTR